MVVFAVLALILSLMPWFATSSNVQGMGSAGNLLGQLGSSFTGKNYGNLAFEKSYSPFGFRDLAETLANYISGKSSGAVGLLMVVYFGWWIGVILSIAGALVAVFTQRHRGVILGIGALVLLVTSFLWVFSYGLYTKAGAATGFPTSALLCGLCCLVVLVLSIVARTKKRR